MASLDDRPTAPDAERGGHAHSLTVGDLIAGKYRVDRFMDQGGMAQIYEATNLELDERVALKLPHTTFRERPDLSDRFREEARALARVRSENVARVHDVVATADNEPVMVMELLAGENLARLIERRELPSFEERIGWMIETCAGVAVAHANGIVHRDLKPENIFIATLLGGRRCAKVLDFGISRLALSSRRTTKPTKVASQIVGTPMYMAPEQIASPHAADPRIDVWSIGVVLFELLAGVPPYTAETPEQVCNLILHGEPKQLGDLLPDLDPDLTDAIERCLQRDPEHRFPTVAELALALLPFAPPRLAPSVEHTMSVLRAAGMTQVEMPHTISLLPHSPRDTVPNSAAPSGPVTRRASAPTPRPAPVSRPAEIIDVRSTQASAMEQPRSRMRIPLLFALGLIVAAVLSFLILRDPSPSPTGNVSAQTAGVRFETTPGDALIEVDGVVVGSSPVTANLPVGRHAISIAKPGYEKVSRVLEVSAETANAPIRFTLTSLVPTAAGGTASPEVAATTGTSTPETRSSGASTWRAPATTTLPTSAPKSVAATSAPTVRVIEDGPSKTKVIE